MTQGDVLWFNPCIPDALRQLQMCLRYRGHTLDVTVTAQELRLHVRESSAAPIRLGVGKDVRKVAAGEETRFDLRKPLPGGGKH